MDEETFKTEMALLRKYERNSQWMPYLVIALFWGGLWWNGIKPDPQIGAVLFAVAVAGLLIYNEVCALRALSIRRHLVAEREKGRAQERADLLL